MKQQRGFTLIELMIVVAIIGILAAIAIPAYQTYVGRAQMAEALILTSGTKAAVHQYHSDRGKWPTDNAEAGLANANQIKGRYVAQVLIDGVDSIATMQGSGVAAAIAGKTLTLTSTYMGGGYAWTCTTTAPGAYVPTSCR